MQYWPDFLPKIRSNPSETINANVIASEGEGRGLQRNRYKTGLVTVPASFTMTGPQFAAFEYLHTELLNCGADWFVGFYYQQSGLPRSAVMRIVDGAYSATAKTLQVWDVSMWLEVKYSG